MPKIGQATNHDPRAVLHHGDCLEVMRGMLGDSIDSVVTDPPAGIHFMGKAWDHGKGGRGQWVAWMCEIAQECLRVVKPGGHALVWSIPRTSHWTATAWEDAGWEVRDKIYHIFGSGFPKSLDVSKAIDKAAGVEREVVGYRNPDGSGVAGGAEADPTGSHIWTGRLTSNEGVTDAAKQWQGWGTALKPAAEEWILLRRPLIGTVAQNVQVHGTGALNIDGCRVHAEDAEEGRVRHGGNGGVTVTTGASQGGVQGGYNHRDDLRPASPAGRWPANVVHDGSDEATAGFPQSSVTGKRTAASKAATVAGTTWLQDNHESTEYTDSGSAARFFYCAKASKSDRNSGLDGKVDVENRHATVKPTELMRYLCRLVTPPNGVVLDPFMGSGSTGKAALLEGFRFVGIEQEEESYLTAKKRVV